MFNESILEAAIRGDFDTSSEEEEDDNVAVVVAMQLTNQCGQKYQYNRLGWDRYVQGLQDKN